MGRNKEGRKRRRNLLKVLAIVVLLLALLVILLPHLVPQGWLKAKVKEALQDATRTNVEVGRVKLGWLSGLVLKEFTLNLPEAAGEPPLLSLAEARVRLKYLPLLKGRIHLREIRLSGMDLYVERDSGGEFNFKPLLLEVGQPARPPDTEAARRPKVKAILLERLQASDAKLTYQDRYTDKSRYIIEFNVDLKAKDTGVYQVRLQAGIKKDAEAVGTLRLDLALHPEQKSLAGKVKIEEVDLSEIAPYISAGLPGAQIAGKASGTFDLNFTPDAWKVAGKMRASPLAGSLGEKAPITFDLPWLEISPTIYTEGDEVPIKIDPLKLTSPAGELVLTGEVAKDGKHFSFETTLKMEPDKIRQMIKDPSIPEEIKTSGILELRANHEIDDEAWRSKGKFDLKELGFVYAGKLNKEPGALAHIRYDLSGRLPSADAPGSPVDLPKEPLSGRSLEKWLKATNGSLQTEVDRLGVGEAFLEEARATVQLSQGLILIEGEGKIFGGDAVGDLNIDFNKEPPPFAGNLKAQKLQANDILRALLKRSLSGINFTGSVELDAKLIGQIHKERRDTLNSIGASGTLTITKGTFQEEDPPAYLSWIFPALNLAAYQFDEAVLDFSWSHSGTSIDMKFEGKVIDLYLVGKQDAVGNFNYDLGVDLWQNLPPEERQILSEVTFARIPLFNLSAQMEEGEIKRKKRYVALPELLLRLADKGLMEKLPSTVLREEIRKIPRRTLKSPEILMDFFLKQILPEEEEKK